MCFHILAYQCDVDSGLVILSDHELPGVPKFGSTGDTRRRDGQSVQVEPGPEKGDNLLLLQEQGNLVYGGHVPDDKNLIQLHLTVQCQLCYGALCEGLFTPACDLELC